MSTHSGNEIPDMCENQCLMDLANDDPCGDCLANYAHWCEVDDSEMDIDWSEYRDLT